jgi:hypothetical protein
MDNLASWKGVVSSLLMKASADTTPESRRVCSQRDRRESPRSVTDRRYTGGSIARVEMRPHVRVVQRTGATSLLVSWSDSTRCCYLDQTWTAASARASGFCALSGQPIRRGDAVFKPSCKRKNRPGNYHEMILATQIPSDQAA